MTAILDNPPCLKTVDSYDIPFSRVECEGNELKYVAEVMRSGWLTTASKSRELEQLFRERIGVSHAFAVNSCTSALHLALDAIGVEPGDEVFVPSMTFTASAEVIRYMGAHPVLLDVDINTANITPEIVERAIVQHPNVKALIAVHFGGRSLELERHNASGILDLCRRHGLKLVEDAAHALPTRHNGKMIGSFGDVTCFSFYANKTMTTGEGGMVTTDHDDYAKRLKVMRLHGINRDIWDRYTSRAISWEYDVIAPGFKYNMPDLNAAVGLGQFERLDEMHQGRIRCALHYFDKLKNVRHLKLPEPAATWDEHSWHLFSIRVLDTAPVSRARLIEVLYENGIGTSVHYKPLHQLSYYRDQYQFAASDYPNAEAWWQQNISLPIYHKLTESQIERVCAVLENTLGSAE